MNSNDEVWNVASGSIRLNSTGNISILADDEDEGRNDIYLKVGAQGHIYINDPIVGRVDTLLQNYPISWYAIKDGPSSVGGSTVIGYRTEQMITQTGETLRTRYYPAIAVYDIVEKQITFNGTTKIVESKEYSSSYYFNGASWVSCDKNSLVFFF